MTDLELAHVAGFFDGEGCISVYEEKTGRYWNTRIRVEVANTDFRPIRILHEHFGGHYRQIKKPNRKEYAQWGLSCKTAIKFLRVILPYLIVKRERAQTAIDIHALNSRKTRSNNRSSLGQFQSIDSTTRKVIAEKTAVIRNLNN